MDPEHALNKTTPILHEYFLNPYYKHFIAFSFMFIFAIVFNIIYLIIDALVDKNKHYKLALKMYDSYEAGRRRRMQQNNPTTKEEMQEMKENCEIDEKKLQEQNRKIEFSVWSYRNLQISFIHSVLCSIWVIVVVANHFNEFFSDLLTFTSWDTYLLITFSCGYFLYDFYDIYSNGHFKIEWVVCVHHVIVLVSFSYNLTQMISLGYTTLALFMEFNSVFLHARKLLKFYGYKNNDIITKINKFLNMFTFTIFRILLLVIIYYCLFLDGHRVQIPYFVMLTTCIVLMTIINVVLFKRLLVKDVLTCNKKKKKSQMITEIDSNSEAEAAHFKLLGIDQESNKNHVNMDQSTTNHPEKFPQNVNF